MLDRRVRAEMRPAVERVPMSGSIEQQTTRPLVLDVQMRFGPARPEIRLRGALDRSNVHQLDDAVDALVAALPADLSSWT